MRNSPSSASLKRGARQKQDGLGEKTTAVQTALRGSVAFRTSFAACPRRRLQHALPLRLLREPLQPRPHRGGPAAGPAPETAVGVATVEGMT